jgi:hypothetical protein
MARMRTLKPEAATSETLTTVPREVRWTFGLLWTHCDDKGRCAFNPKLIKAALYPLDDDVTTDVVVDEIDQLEQIGAVCVYEVGGRQYLHVPHWAEHQHPNRPQDSKLPPCPGGEGSDHAQQDRPEPSSSTAEQLTDDAVNDHGGLTPVLSCLVEAGTGDGEGEGEEQLPCSTASSDPFERFDEFWTAYPLHVSKLKARQRWLTQIKAGVDPQVMIDGAESYARQVRGKDREHIKHPDGWINGRRWEDEPVKAPVRHSSTEAWG